MNAHQLLAKRLDALPNGFPPAEDGSEIRLLEYLYSAEEAELAAMLKLHAETPAEIASRLGRDEKELRLMLKGMVRRGLIRAEKTDHGLGYGLLPFVVGIYEYQIGRIDGELAALFEDYYQQAFTKMLEVSPQVHRVIPVNETIKANMEIAPYESVTGIVDQAKAWGVLDCICRVQKALIGDPCDHPVDVCMTMSPVAGAFDHNQVIKALTKAEALETLSRAADAGLVHSVSNSQEGLSYICNCCTCSCGILRGMAEMGVANVVARSSFVNTVDPGLCSGCETCLDYCQFDALAMDDLLMTVNVIRCVGCGVCVPHCDTGAMALVTWEDAVSPPETEMDWMADRAAARGLDMKDVL